MIEDFSLQSLIHEAQVYRSQGLLEESKEKYQSALQLLRNGTSVGNHQELIVGVNEKINEIERDIAEFNKIDETPKLSQDVQNLIQKVFSFSQTKEMSEVEGVLALAKFGQYEQALVEFHRLLGKGVAPAVVAKHILECHLALSSPDAAIAQFEQWSLKSLLPNEDLEQVRAFLKDALRTKGIEVNLPSLDKAPSKKNRVEGNKTIALDIYSVKIQLDDESDISHEVDFDVTFQSGNTISIIVPADQRELSEYLKLGMPLSKIKFYTPVVVFQGKGVISGKTKIRIGPKQGDYVLDIKIDVK